MKWRVTAINVFLLFAGFIVTLSAKEKGDVSPTGTFTHVLVDTIDGVLFSVATDKILYASGDLLQVRYRITNHTMATVLYDFTTTCQFELQVIGSDGDILYSLYAPRLTDVRSKECKPEASHIMLAPSAEKSIQFDAISLKLKLSDTFTVKTQMAGYPLSAVPIKINYLAVPAATAPVALEGNTGIKPTIEFNNETKMLVIRVNYAQRLTISAFILTGQKIDKLSCEKFLAPGTHLISFKNHKLTDGVVIFKVEGNGFSETKTINLAR
jgi:hypothetical protein